MVMLMSDRSDCDHTGTNLVRNVHYYCPACNTCISGTQAQAVPIVVLEKLAESLEGTEWETQEANLQARHDAGELRAIIDSYE